MYSCRKIIILIVILMLLVSCKEFTPSSLEKVLIELSQTLETDHFIFHYSPGDFVYSLRMEAFHVWATDLLKVTPSRKINYYKYKDRNQQKVLTGATSTGYADSTDFSVHTTLPWMNHECAHLYTSLIGRPTSFFNEGIAVALQTDPYNGDYVTREKSGEEIHSLVKRYKKSGLLFPVEDIVESEGFITHDYTITYPQAGSFMKYLTDTYGIEKLKLLLNSVKYGDSKSVIFDKFLSVYNVFLYQVEKDWLMFLDS